MADFQAASEHLEQILTKTSERMNAGKKPDVMTVAQKIEQYPQPETEQARAEQMVVTKYFSELAGLIKSAKNSPMLRDDVPPEILSRDPAAKAFLTKYMAAEQTFASLISSELAFSAVPKSRETYHQFIDDVTGRARTDGLTDLLKSSWDLFHLLKAPQTGLEKLGMLWPTVASEVALKTVFEYAYGCVVDRASASLDSKCGIDLIVYRNDTDREQGIPLMYVDAKSFLGAGDEVLIEKSRHTPQHLQILKSSFVDRRLFQVGYGGTDLTVLPHLVMYYPSPMNTSSDSYAEPVLGLPSVTGLNKVDFALERYCTYNGLQSTMNALRTPSYGHE